MNELEKNQMEGYSIITERCPFCGRKVQSNHHIVYRSQGGTKGPVIAVCGTDNVTGCHGLFHQHRLHLRWSFLKGCWEWLKTDEPTNEQRALVMDGWKVLQVKS